MSRTRLIVLAAGAVIAVLLGAFGGGSQDATAPTTATTTTTTVAGEPAPACPASGCGTGEVAGTTKTAVIVTAVAGGLALVWCRRRAKLLAAGA